MLIRRQLRFGGQVAVRAGHFQIFQGHRMHLRDCQRSALALLVTLKPTDAAGISNAECEAVISFCLTQRSLTLGTLVNMQITFQINAP